MRKLNLKISKKQIVLLILVVTGLVLYGLTTLLSDIFIRKVPTQQSAMLWDADGRSEMISLFVNESDSLDKEAITRLEYTLTEKYKEESIEAPSENARLFVSAYSNVTTVSLSSPRGESLSCTAYAVGGDFFRFHPMKLVSGSFLVEDDFRKSGIVLDREAAWKLFGAIDVDGMTVTYNGKDYTVVGIVDSDKGYKAKEANAPESCVYLPIEAFDNINAVCYEVILPNPVSGFALKQAKEAFSSVYISEDKSVIVDNSKRFEWLTSLKRALKWTGRGMSFKEVKYPYWENQAIAVENIVDVLSVLRVLFIVPPFVIIVVSIICFHPLRRLKLLVLRIVEKFRR